MVNLGDEFPNFNANTTNGTISFHDWLGDSWCIFFSHPNAFTPVCTTELGRVAQLIPEFTKRNCKVIGCSCDGVQIQKDWIEWIEWFLSCPRITYVWSKLYMPEEGLTAETEKLLLTSINHEDIYD